jgi:hypothetical protein
MTRTAHQPGRPRRSGASTDDGLHIPLEVFCVIYTTCGPIGERHHQVCPPLYETSRQAEMELIHLRATGSSNGTYSVWKAATYIEPAGWLYDLVVADGSIIRASDSPRTNGQIFHRQRPDA